MPISMVYHHLERALAQKWAYRIEQSGFEVDLAPVGYAVGSDEWVKKVLADLKSAEAIIVLISQKAIEDEWFEERVRFAVQEKKLLLPIMVEHANMPFYLSTYQFIDASEASPQALDSILDVLRSTLPARISCFISYSRTDKEFAVELASALKSKGVNVWRDEDDIPAGASWDQEIQKALSKCTHVLFVATPSSVDSPNVLDEVSFARINDKKIIPLILEDCSLPLQVHRAQWVDFRGDDKQGIENLLEQLGIS